MSVRRAEPQDAPDLASLHAAIFPDDAWDLAFWTGIGARPFDRVFLLGEPPRALGAVRLLGEEAEILTVGTTAPGKGDGGSLVEAMAAAAAEAGSRRLFLEVSAANKAALALYGRCGFLAAGRRRRYYKDGSDAVVMRLDLPQPEE